MLLQQIFNSMIDINRSNWQNLMPELSKMMIREHYARNFDFVLSYIAEDISWIGPLEEQYTVGKDIFAEKLTPEQDTQVVVSEDEYYIAASNKDFCTVVGKYVATTAPGSELLLKVKQRVTFQWIWRDKRPQVIHLHLSNPWEYVDKNEPFPYRAAKEAYDYICQNHISDNKIVALKSTDNDTMFVELDKIIYVEAQRTHCIIHGMDRSIIVKNKISELTREFPEQFCRVHRCFLVNINYVVKTMRYEVVLCNKVVLPVPEKKYLMVRNQILQYNKNHSRVTSW